MLEAAMAIVSIEPTTSWLASESAPTEPSTYSYQWKANSRLQAFTWDKTKSAILTVVVIEVVQLLLITIFKQDYPRAVFD
jgi:hypothetical protein